MPKEMLQTQLARIMESRQFCNAPRLSRFLSYVVNESLAGRFDRLKGYTIGLEVFDRPDDFDPQTDTIVRVQARALRQKLGQYYALEGRDDPVHITIAKGSYVPAFHRAVEIGAHAGTQMALPVAASSKPSIAVLPFDDFSQETGHEYFSHGLTEETIANLSCFRELSVFSRLTTEQAKLNGLSIRQIYDEFQPDFVLEGSFRIDSQMVFITINLVEARAGEIILTQHFSHEMTPKAMYAIQDEMALTISARIADRFGPLGQYARRSTQAGHSQKWDTYLWISRYHQYSVQLSAADRQEIKDGLTKALKSDPTSSDAHAILALTTVDEYRMTFAAQSTAEILDYALGEAEQAVQCDPVNASAHKALAIVRFHRREFDLFEASAARALALNPGHPDMFAMLGICYCMQANWDVAMPMLDMAIALNPLQPGWYHIPKAIGLVMTSRPAEAIAEMHIAPLPGAFFYHCHLLWFLVEAGDMKAAQLEKSRLLEALPEFEAVIMRHLHAWCVDDGILRRAVAAWRRAGLDVTAHDMAR
jgi:TolB-like protein